MNPPWLFCSQFNAGEAKLDEGEGRHAVRSLRLRAGDAVMVFDGRGNVGQGRLVEAEANTDATRRPGRSDGKRGGQIAVAVERVESIPPAERRLTLIVAACKGPRLDFLVEKCTELGATRLVFAEFARSVVRVGATHIEKLRRTAIEACKQCGRAWLPEIEAGLRLGDAVARRGGAALLVGHLAAEAVSLGARLHEHARDAQDVAVVIGPEGGLTLEEVDALRTAGAQLVRLGEHVLRVETAAVSVAAAWGAG